MVRAMSQEDDPKRGILSGLEKGLGIWREDKLAGSKFRLETGRFLTTTATRLSNRSCRGRQPEQL